MRRRCCQRAGVLILVALLASGVLLLRVQQRKPVTIDYLDADKNNRLSKGKFASEQHHKEQDHIVALERVYRVTGKSSLSDYSDSNDVHHINDSTIKREPEQQNRIDDIQLQRRFPRYMIIGFEKAGTKALFEALKLHPSLRGPETERRFFSKYYSKGLSSYLIRLPDPPPGGFTIEKSPDYITQPNVPMRILNTSKMIHVDSSSLKFIVVLRNPIDRAMSEYLERNVLKRFHHKHLLPSFSKMVLTAAGKVNSSVAFVNSSCYAQHIRNWLRVFDKEQMCFVDEEKFISDPYEELHALEQCMGLMPFFCKDNFVYLQRRGFYCFHVGNKHMCMNANKGRNHPVIPRPTSMKLKAFFHPWNERLLNLTGRKFTNWEAP